MTKKKAIFFMILGIIPVAIAVIFFITYLFQPLFLRRNYLDRITGLNIPRTSIIVEYRFGINSFGAQPFFAKLQLSQEEYHDLKRDFEFNEKHTYMFNFMQQRHGYTSLSVDDIVDIGARYRMTRKTSFFFAGSTRSVEMLFVTIADGNHFLYVFY